MPWIMCWWGHGRRHTGKRRPPYSYANSRALAHAKASDLGLLWSSPATGMTLELGLRQNVPAERIACVRVQALWVALRALAFAGLVAEASALAANSSAF